MTVHLGMFNILSNNLYPWMSSLHFALCSVSFLFFFHTHGYTCITIIIISFLCNKQTIHINITWYTIFQIKTTLLPVLHNNWNMSSIFFSSVKCRILWPNTYCKCQFTQNVIRDEIEWCRWHHYYVYSLYGIVLFRFLFVHKKLQLRSQ